MKLRQKLLAYSLTGALIAAGIAGFGFIDSGVKNGMEAVFTSADAVIERPVIVLDAGHGGCC